VLTVVLFNLTSLQIFYLNSCIRVGYYKSFGETCFLHFHYRISENHLPEYMVSHYFKILNTELQINILYSQFALNLPCKKFSPK